VVVELTEPADGAVVGRYSYLSKGVDIPLQARSSDNGEYVLAEEARCEPGLCTPNEDYVVPEPPIAGTWTLVPAEDGETLAGTWESGGKSLPISLERRGSRPLPDGVEVSPMGLHDSVLTQLMQSNTSFAPETSPYDFLKMDVALEEGPIEELEGSRFRYVTDPRTKFKFPRVVSLSDGSDIGPANGALARGHARLNYFALDCASQAYAGFGGNDSMLEMGAGTLGDFEYETVTLTYLSPRVMTWIEGGSTFCANAHPNNHADTTMVDVRTGQPLALGRILKDWEPTKSMIDYEPPADREAALERPGDYFWTAGQPLIDYAIAHREPSSDAAFEAECGVDALIASNLAFRFEPGDLLVFTLEGLPHVNYACTQDLVTVPLAEIPELLAPEAADYFPGLAR